MSRARVGFLVSFAVVLLIGGALSCSKCRQEPPPPVAERYLHDPKLTDAVDTICGPGAMDAPCAGDIFPGMDGPNLKLTKADMRGRLVWNVWVGDGGKMWDFLAQHAFGTADLIKTIDSRERAHRLTRIGVINQPGFQAATKPDKYGLFIDEPKPGDPDGEIDKKLNYYTYGRSTGVVGLRMTDNPAFVNNKAAQDAWMSHIDKQTGINRDFYENEKYYTDPTLVRPYIVGMACAFCHIQPDPVRPPADAENPKWENLNDFAGAQYLKVWAVFVPPNPKNDQSFVWQLIHSNPQGALDTSFIATDYLNNPGTMNGVYLLPARLGRGSHATLTKPTAPDQEYIAGGALDLLHIQDDIKSGKMTVPRVLKQGDDSVGIVAALSRVYLNIGESWPEWQKHFIPLVGGLDQTPVPVKTLQETSPSWNWSEERAPDLAGYLVKVAQPLLLKDAPNSATYLKADAKTLANGRKVFAENCAGCHSSKKPTDGSAPGSDAAKAWYITHVNDPDFFTDNFLADEIPRPVNFIGTNATRAAATNAMRGHIWDNFSSETYKSRAQIKPLDLTNPIDGTPIKFQIQGNGPGYYRPPSLVSLWSSAPYLHNNTVGDDFGDPSVDGRMRAFKNGIEKMLLLKPRTNIIWKTTAKSYISIPSSYLSLPPTFLPKVLPPLLTKAIKDVDPKAFGPDGKLISPLVRAIKDADPKAIDANGNILLGPIPKGTPINLLSNLDLDGSGISPSNPIAGRKIVAKALLSAVVALAEIRDKHMNDAQATARLKLIVPDLLAANKCPDFIEDKGHLFGTTLPEKDRRDLIELLKTF